MLYELWARVQGEIIDEHNERIDPAFAASQVPRSHLGAIDQLAAQTNALAEAGGPGTIGIESEQVELGLSLAFGAFAEDRKVLAVGVDLAPVLPGDLLQDPELLKVADCLISGGLGHTEGLCGDWWADENPADRVVVQPQRGRCCAPKLMDPSAVAFDHRDITGCRGCAFGYLGDSFQEEPKPCLPLAVISDALEMVVYSLRLRFR
jgi:hypothetical protein